MICNNCILSENEDPKITFNDKGVCNYCVAFYYAEKQRRIDKTNWPWIVYEMKKVGKGKDYDCLLGLSGGVDSSLCLHYLIEQGLRPLCYSIDNGWQTPEANENIMRMVEGLKVPFYRYNINLDKFRELQEAFIMAGQKNIEIPSDAIIRATAYEMADKYKIKYIISGGNLATEGIMPENFGYNPSDLKHIKGVYRKIIGKKLEGLPLMSLFDYIWYRFIKKIKVINMLDYYEYNRTEAIKLLSEKYEYKDYGTKHGESYFTKWFQEYYLPKKFNLDKRIPHLSSMINSAQMSRKDALKELEKPLQGYLINDMISGSLGINIKDLMEIKPQSYKDYPNNEKFINLLSKIYAITKRKNNNLGR